MLTCQHFQKSVLYSFFAFFGLLLVSCGGKHEIDTASVSLAQMTPAVNDTRANDERFIVRAAEINFDEILRGKLAQKRATSEEVKALGQLLEESNRNAKSAIAAIAIPKSIKYPVDPPQAAHAAYDSLNTARIEEFDMEYIRVVIEGHNSAISLFETATQGSLDPALKTWAITRLSEIRMHLAKANELNARMNPVSELVE